MATVQTLKDIGKMNDKTNFGKAVWLFFAKAKEEQRLTQNQCKLLHICFYPTAPVLRSN
jgi:hypothetical protein